MREEIERLMVMVRDITKQKDAAADITERKKSEESLIESERLLRKSQKVAHLGLDFDVTGQPVKLIGTVSDITARKLVEEALGTSEYEFRLLAESMPQIVWITRADGWNIYFNQQWVEYTGLSLEESYGNGWNKPYHPEDLQKVWVTWQNAINNNSTYSIESRLRRADGAYKWHLIRGVPIFDERGAILKWFGTCK